MNYPSELTIDWNVSGSNIWKGFESILDMLAVLSSLIYPDNLIKDLRAVLNQQQDDK